jgi:hypothetical protein
MVPSSNCLIGISIEVIEECSKKKHLYQIHLEGMFMLNTCWMQKYVYIDNYEIFQEIHFLKGPIKINPSVLKMLFSFGMKHHKIFIHCTYINKFFVWFYLFYEFVMILKQIFMIANIQNSSPSLETVRQTWNDALTAEWIRTRYVFFKYQRTQLLLDTL